MMETEPANRRKSTCKSWDLVGRGGRKEMEQQRRPVFQELVVVGSIRDHMSVERSLSIAGMETRSDWKLIENHNRARRQSIRNRARFGSES